MSNGAPSPEVTPVSTGAGKTESIGFAQLPWQKMVVWGAFLLALYALRDFVFVVFMTFLLSYLVRGVVTAIARRVSPQHERPRLEQMLTAGTFTLILLAGYVGWVVLTPRVFEQTRAIVSRIRHFNVQDEFDSFLNRTVGSYLFHQRYGKPGDPAYEKVFRAFQEKGRLGEGLYQQFPTLRAPLISGFEAQYESQELRQLQEALLQGGDAVKKFDRWFLQEKAPGLLERHREAYLSRWLKDHATPEGGQTTRGPPEGARLRGTPRRRDPPAHSRGRQERPCHLWRAKTGVGASDGPPALAGAAPLP